MFGWFKRKAKNISRVATLKDHGTMTISEQTKEAIDSVLSRMNELPNLHIEAESSWNYDPSKYSIVGSCIGHPTRVRIEDDDAAWDLVEKDLKAKFHKKKHSHLLAELKALEVK